MQSTFLTGLTPARHGIVGNGWYFRDLGEVSLWRQHNRLVGGEKLWETARRRAPARAARRPGRRTGWVPAVPVPGTHRRLAFQRVDRRHPRPPTRHDTPNTDPSCCPPTPTPRPSSNAPATCPPPPSETSSCPDEACT
ncbi:alkaline phosphatase family protein [Saccharothrix sp.]|uniref:alkaline phosphatase family protein n=1 Tax=Saccharothrix sp. TaxID=1873460 RepID=UPI0035C86B77